MLLKRSFRLFRQFLLCSVSASLIAASPVSAAKEEVETPETIKQALSDFPTTLTGTYLSARIAQEEEDLAMAAHFYMQALEKEPENANLLERSFVLTLAIGDHDVAFKLADRMAELKAKREAARAEAAKTQEGAASQSQDDESGEGHVTPMVHLALGVKALKGKSYASATNNFGTGITELTNNPADLLGPSQMHQNINSPRLLNASAQKGPFALLTQTILNAWSQIGQDRKALDAVLPLLDQENSTEINQFFYSLHSGLIAAYAKDYPKAIAFLESSLNDDPNSVSTAEALLNVLLKADAKQKAREVLDRFMKSAASLEDKAWLEATYGPMEPVASFVRTPQDGAAELFSTLGDALSQEQALEGGALYLQFADYLRPDHSRTQFALARLFERMNNDAQAMEHFNAVADNSALYRSSQRLSGFTLTRLERIDEAIERLTALLAEDPGDLETISILARVYQSDDRFQESIDVLTKGINGLSQKRDIHWSLYFLRGSAYDQIKDWPNTEKDMTSALDLFPNQPTVLNYLGYSWVDRGLNLEKALEMIRQAVALRPYDGFFVDSLGWAHYRLGQYEEAVAFLERAVELRPEDPTITDHLGDAYWKAERKDEAYFQWERVKTMNPKYELLNQVLKKLEHGLIETDKTASDTNGS